MEGIVIRRVPKARIVNTNSDDFLALVKLHRDLFRADFSPDWASAAWWVAEMSGKIVGFLGVEGAYPLKGYAHFARVGVKTGCQGHGIAKRLIRCAVRCAQSEGYHNAVCYTRDNPQSANAFIACGFRLYRPTTAWATKDAVYLIKHL